MMQIIECGGGGRCGWLSLDYLLRFDSQKYLAEQVAHGSIADRVLSLALQELYANDASVRHWIRASPTRLQALRGRGVRQQIKSLLKTRVEFNQAWGLLLVSTDYFRRNRLTLSLIDEQMRVHPYPIRGRTHSIYLYGGNGHWQAATFS